MFVKIGLANQTLWGLTGRIDFVQDFLERCPVQSVLKRTSIASKGFSIEDSFKCQKEIRYFWKRIVGNVSDHGSKTVPLFFFNVKYLL